MNSIEVPQNGAVVAVRRGAALAKVGDTPISDLERGPKYAKKALRTIISSLLVLLQTLAACSIDAGVYEHGQVKLPVLCTMTDFHTVVSHVLCVYRAIHSIFRDECGTSDEDEEYLNQMLKVCHASVEFGRELASMTGLDFSGLAAPSHSHESVNEFVALVTSFLLGFRTGISSKDAGVSHADVREFITRTAAAVENIVCRCCTARHPQLPEIPIGLVKKGICQLFALFLFVKYTDNERANDFIRTLGEDAVMWSERLVKKSKPDEAKAVVDFSRYVLLMLMSLFTSGVELCEASGHMPIDPTDPSSGTGVSIMGLLFCFGKEVVEIFRIFFDENSGYWRSAISENDRSDHVSAFASYGTLGQIMSEWAAAANCRIEHPETLAMKQRALQSFRDRISVTMVAIWVSLGQFSRTSHSRYGTPINFPDVERRVANLFGYIIRDEFKNVGGCDDRFPSEGTAELKAVRKAVLDLRSACSRFLTTETSVTTSRRLDPKLPVTHTPAFDGMDVDPVTYTPSAGAGGAGSVPALPAPHVPFPRNLPAPVTGLAGPEVGAVLWPFAAGCCTNPPSVATGPIGNLLAQLSCLCSITNEQLRTVSIGELDELMRALMNSFAIILVVREGSQRLSLANLSSQFPMLGHGAKIGNERTLNDVEDAALRVAGCIDALGRAPLDGGATAEVDAVVRARQALRDAIQSATQYSTVALESAVTALVSANAAFVDSIMPPALDTPMRGSIRRLCA